MYMCIEALIKDCHKVILHQLELLKVQLEKHNNKLRGSLDLKKAKNASKIQQNTVHLDITNITTSPYKRSMA